MTARVSLLEPDASLGRKGRKLEDPVDKVIWPSFCENHLDAISSAPFCAKSLSLMNGKTIMPTSIGADAVLLIAAFLTDLDIKYFLRICKELGLTALIEGDGTCPEDKWCSLIGINNRSLETFIVDTSNTETLLEKHGDAITEKGILVVGESGLFSPDDVAYVQNVGVSAVLVGESLVKQEEPGRAIAGLFGKDLLHCSN